MEFTQKAYAKINWALEVVSKRPDGYHELDMLMQTIDLCDDLHFQEDEDLSLTCDGVEIPEDGHNLILKAARALSDDIGQRRGARIHLTKRIPVQAGLGGGSADCAAALIALNRLWNIHLSEDRLLKIGASLGADVPFCMGRGLARVQGIGERLCWIPGNRRFFMVILQPGTGLSTAQVFAQWDKAHESLAINMNMDEAQKALEKGDLKNLSRFAGNALEKPAMTLMPEIAYVKQTLTDMGADFVQMTGSGSCVFGVFEAEEKALEAQRRLGDCGAIFARTCP